MNNWLKGGLIALLLSPAIASAGWIGYDNGDAWGQVFAVGQGDGYGVKFEPGEVGTLYRMKAHIGRHTDSAWDGFNVKLYNWNGTLEQPGSLVADLGILIGSGDQHGWFELDCPDVYWGSTAPFVIVLLNRYTEPNVDTIFIDSNGVSASGLYWYFLNGSWQQYNPAGDLMVQALFSGVPVESNSLGSIKATFK